VFREEGSRVTLRGYIPSMTLSWLIYTAGEGMSTSTSVVGGPDWRNQTAYAIDAQSQKPATQLEFQAMLRTLLEDRFGLKIHREAIEGDIYALVLDRSDGKLGPKVQQWTGTCANGRTPSVRPSTCLHKTTYTPAPTPRSHPQPRLNYLQFHRGVRTAGGSGRSHCASGNRPRRPHFFDSRTARRCRPHSEAGVSEVCRLQDPECRRQGTTNPGLQRTP
jgi:hypothetical protein